MTHALQGPTQVVVGQILSVLPVLIRCVGQEVEDKNDIPCNRNEYSWPSPILIGHHALAHTQI